MTTFSIENFGCRATHADAAAIEHQLLDRGFTRAQAHRDSDIVVLNTCTVTAAADAQARDAIRHVHAANRSARILVTGCYAQRAPEELARLDGVEWVVGNSHQSSIPDLAMLDAGVCSSDAQRSPDFVPASMLATDALSLARAPAKILTGDIFAQSSFFGAPLVGDDSERTRPTLKIQDGCNNRCSYCVIPFVRGKSRSLPPDRVLAEVRRLVTDGAREIVLSGINLGSYANDLAPRASLAALLRRVMAETSLDRLRLSSIEPMDVTRDFVELVAAENRIAPHFHMPLQSASDAILKLMHRSYRAAHYQRRLEIVRELSPDAAIGTDVIVGFPGESENDFHATFDFIERQPFTYLHVFSFSARPGTAAESLSGQVSPAVIRDRARTLRALGLKKASAFRASQRGRLVRALTLRRKRDGWTEVLSGNYLKLRVAGDWPPNTWLDVRVTADSADVTVPAEGLSTQSGF
ncbi:MAG TPA: tRNA (N(6)-L-threonylcarbamoyladenosine(37)-C(2))-methylthiotransferase MtaB [Candidatus Acidoferrales bacterium]|nr:tRNA (N(6)-L-threonylcarbamoyladenosine(37)-C(2))-methylthiotransferase MtaB [Candidatus Acidoferrales bacterium]